jgi:hypothetical protein
MDLFFLEVSDGGEEMMWEEWKESKGLEERQRVITKYRFTEKEQKYLDGDEEVGSDEEMVKKWMDGNDPGKPALMFMKKLKMNVRSWMEFLIEKTADEWVLTRIAEVTNTYWRVRAEEDEKERVEAFWEWERAHFFVEDAEEHFAFEGDEDEGPEWEVYEGYVADEKEKMATLNWQRRRVEEDQELEETWRMKAMIRLCATAAMRSETGKSGLLVEVIGGGMEEEIVAWNKPDGWREEERRKDEEADAEALAEEMDLADGASGPSDSEEGGRERIGPNGEDDVEEDSGRMEEDRPEEEPD